MLSSFLCYALLVALLFTTSQAQSGDSLAATLVPRPAVFSLNFSVAPTGTTGWSWIANDAADSTAAQGQHQGLAVLNQTLTDSYIDLTTATGANSAGAVLGPIGGQGFYPEGNALAGWSFEFVVKFTSTQYSSIPLMALSDVPLSDPVSTLLALGFGIHQDFDLNDPDVGNRLELVNANNASATLVPLAATFGLVEFVTPAPGVWYHIVMSLQSGSYSLSSGSATWYMYVNGLPYTLANALSPNATLTAQQGANLPQNVTRAVQQLGGWVELDAFRVYDYVLDEATVTALANAYGVLETVGPKLVSYTYPASAESSAMLAVVPTPPILDLDFAFNPAGTVPGITTTTYEWEANDASDSGLLQSLHSGLVVFNGSNYIDLNTVTGPTSCGVLLPLFGLPGSGNGSAQGLSIEVVFKFAAGLSGNNNGDKLFSFGQGGSEVVDLPYDSNDLQLEEQNQIAPGVGPGYVSNKIGGDYGIAPFASGVWYHFVWVWSQPSFTNYSATWNIYVNGTLTPNSPFLNANFPPPVQRPIALIAGAAYNNGNLAYTLDALRIYDYALNATTVAQLAALKGAGPLFTGQPPAPPASSSSSGPSQPAASSSSSSAAGVASSSSAAPTAAASSSSAPIASSSSSSAAAAPSSSTGAALSSSTAPPPFVTSASSSSSTPTPPASVTSSSSTATPPPPPFVTSSSSALSQPKGSGAVVTAQAASLSLLLGGALAALLLLAVAA